MTENIEKPTYTTRATFNGHDKQAHEDVRQTAIVLLQQDGTDFFRVNIKRGPDLASVRDKANKGEWMDAKLNVVEGKAPTLLLSTWNGKEAAADNQYTSKGVLFFNNQSRDGTKDYESTLVSYKDEKDGFTNLFVGLGADWLKEQGIDIRVKPKAPANESEPTPG